MMKTIAIIGASVDRAKYGNKAKTKAKVKAKAKAKRRGRQLRGGR